MADFTIDGSAQARVSLVSGSTYKIDFGNRITSVDIRKVGAGTVAIGVDKDLTDINDVKGFTLDDNAPSYGPITKDGNDTIGYLYVVANANMSFEFKTVIN